MGKKDQAEALLQKTISKHNQLLEYEKSKTSNELVLFIKDLIDDYSTILDLSPREKNSRNNRGLAKANLAELYMNLGKNDEAMEEFDRAIGDFSMVLAYDDAYLMSYGNRATANSNISKLYTKIDEDILALQYLRYVNDDYNSILKIDSTIEKIISEKASVTFDLGEAYALQEDISKSFNYFEESIYYHLKMLNSVSDEVDIMALNNVALAKIKMAEIYAKEKKIQKEIVLYEESNYYYREILKYNANDTGAMNDISFNLDILANIYEDLGDYQKAIEFFKKAIDSARMVLNVDSTNRGSLTNIAVSKSNMAMVYSLLGQDREAIELYCESIKDASTAVGLESNDIKSINNMAISHTELAKIYRYEAIKEQDNSLMEKAMSHYEKSSKYYSNAIEIDETDSISYINQSLNYAEMGTLYIYVKDNLKAIEIFEISLNILYQARVIGGDSEQITHQISQRKFELAQVHKMEGNMDKYGKFLEESLQTISFSSLELNVINDRASMQSEMGLLYLDKSQEDRAEESLLNALEDYLLALKLNPNNIMILNNIANTLDFLVKISNNNHYIQKALWVNIKLMELYDRYYIDIGSEDDSFSLTQKMTYPLSRLLDIYSNTNADKSCIEALELIKSKKLKQLLFSSGDYLLLDESLRVEFEMIRAKLEEIKKEIKRGDSFFDRERQSRLYEEFQDYSQQLSKLLTTDRREELNIYEKLDSQSVVIYPIYDDKKITIISVRKVEDDLDVKISQTDIVSKIRFSDYLLFIKYIESLFKAKAPLQEEFLDKINNIGIDEKIKRHIFEKKEGKFVSLKISEEEFLHEYKYEILQIALSHIKETIIESIPKGINKIFFAPFGDLNLLPLHAISIGNAYLIEKYEINYIPSLSILNHLKNSSNRDSDNLFVSLSKDDLHLEAEVCQGIVGGKHLIDIDAKEFKEYVDKKHFNIIHLSTHGHADISNPLRSYIEFKESMLPLFDIHGLKLNANLVMLSACETYLSKVKGADEVLAFERAFLIAGARNVISTFSTVNIDRSQDFMELFYQSFNNSESISKAFQEACVRDIEDNGSMEWSLFRFTRS